MRLHRRGRKVEATPHGGGVATTNCFRQTAPKPPETHDAADRPGAERRDSRRALTSSQALQNRRGLKRRATVFCSRFTAKTALPRCR
jgi:hypothetical protein